MERRCGTCNRLISVEKRRCPCGAKGHGTTPQQAQRRLARDLPALLAGLLGSLAVQTGIGVLLH